MQKMEQLTASREQCDKLVELGVEPKAYLWHTVEDDDPQPNDKEGNPILKYEVCLLMNPQPRRGIYGTLPAWTKAELDVMIGPDWGKPDFIEKSQIGKAGNPNEYAVYYPEKMKTFKNGADASADALIYLIEKRVLKIEDINERYKIFFKH